MKIKLVRIFMMLCMTFSFVGCQEVQRIDTKNDDGKEVMDLDYRDFDMVAGQMAQSILTSGILNNPNNSKYVISTGEIENLTTKRLNFDTARLMAKIEEEILNSGQAIMTSAVGSKKSIDSMVHDIRDVRESDYGDEFKEGTIAGKKQLIAPDLNISGKIFQPRKINYDSSGTYVKIRDYHGAYYSKQQQVEYYFQLKITDLKTGLRVWQKEILIGKRGGNTAIGYRETE